MRFTIATVCGYVMPHLQACDCSAMLPSPCIGMPKRFSSGFNSSLVRMPTSAMRRRSSAASATVSTSSSESRLMQTPFSTAIAISAGDLFEPLRTSREPGVPHRSEKYISPTPKASPPAPSWVMMWRTASALLALLAYSTSTSG